MTNEETNEKVETLLAEVDEKIEEVDKEAEQIAKVFKYFDMAHAAIGVVGFGAVVGLAIKESIKK